MQLRDKSKTEYARAVKKVSASFTKLFGKSKDGESKDGESKDLSKKGGAKFFLPEALREEANAVSDSLSMVKSQTKIQEENLEIVELQKTLIGIIQKMICKIQLQMGFNFLKKEGYWSNNT